MLRAIAAGTVCVLLGIYAGTELRSQKDGLHAWLLALETMSIHCNFARETPAEILKAGAVHVPMLEKSLEAKTVSAQRRLMSEHKLPIAIQNAVIPALQAIMNGSTEEQTQHIQLAIGELKMLFQAAREKCDRNAGLYLSLGVWGGLCAALILM